MGETQTLGDCDLRISTIAHIIIGGFSPPSIGSKPRRVRLRGPRDRTFMDPSFGRWPLSSVTVVRHLFHHLIGRPTTPSPLPPPSPYKSSSSAGSLRAHMSVPVVVTGYQSSSLVVRRCNGFAHNTAGAAVRVTLSPRRMSRSNIFVIVIFYRLSRFV